MNPNRRSTTIAGMLYIAGTVAGILSVVPSVDDPAYLVKISANESQVIIGALFQLIMAVAYVGIAISLYPNLRTYNEGLALGFAGFRIIAAVFLFIGAIILLLLLPVSREFVKSGAPVASYFQTAGEFLRAGRDLVNHVAMILAVSLGGLMFYYMLYHTRQVPRWLSGWGFAGAIITLSASLLLMFRLIGLITPVYMVLNLPMALQEMVLAGWLIIKGFNASAGTPKSADALY